MRQNFLKVSKMKTIERIKERVNIKVQIIEMGLDYCIVITGGDTPHLGSITVGSVNEFEKTISFKSHMEHVITEMFFKELIIESNRNYIICCGIHLDNITKEEIECVYELVKELIYQTKEFIKLKEE